MVPDAGKQPVLGTIPGHKPEPNASKVTFNRNRTPFLRIENIAATRSIQVKRKSPRLKGSEAKTKVVEDGNTSIKSRTSIHGDTEDHNKS